LKVDERILILTIRGLLVKNYFLAMYARCGYHVNMTPESITSYVRRRLAGVPRQHARIAREIGIPQTTVSRIHSGTTTNPTLKTIEPILAWFREQDAAVKAIKLKRRKQA
jgi:transcriptional regulator with XRE-family HTH domain